MLHLSATKESFSKGKRRIMSEFEFLNAKINSRGNKEQFCAHFGYKTPWGTNPENAKRKGCFITDNMGYKIFRGIY